MSSKQQWDSWVLISYNIATGNRSIIGVVDCPFEPCNMTPFYSTDKKHRQRWVKLRDRADMTIHETGDVHICGFI